MYRIFLNVSVDCNMFLLKFCFYCRCVVIVRDLGIGGKNNFFSFNLFDIRILFVKDLLIIILIYGD